MPALASRSILGVWWTSLWESGRPAIIGTDVSVQPWSSVKKRMMFGRSAACCVGESGDMNAFHFFPGGRFSRASTIFTLYLAKS